MILRLNCNSAFVSALIKPFPRLSRNITKGPGVLRRRCRNECLTSIKENKLFIRQYCTTKETAGITKSITAEARPSVAVKNVETTLSSIPSNLEIEQPTLDPETLLAAKKKAMELLKESPLPPPLKVKKRPLRVDFNVHTQERNFITPIRAMSDFLLKTSDLEGLRKTKRRSPYENEPPITVYWRKDVENRAIEVWGSRKNLDRELLAQEMERKLTQQNSFNTKKRLREYRRERSGQNDFATNDNSGLWGPSGKVVLTAISINGCNCAFKFLTWLYTGSSSMFSEFIHSAADTLNQIILAYGIHKSVQQPTSTHPYGYSTMKYVSSLISGVAIFCVGAGVSAYHGVKGLIHPAEVDSLFWAFCVLGGSLASEGATLLVAIKNIRKGAAAEGMDFWSYIANVRDPSVNVVLLEDTAAVIGVVVAASCMALTTHFDTHVYDAFGSIIIGGILGGVAMFIIRSNTAALIGKSIPIERLNKINVELESDVMIRAIHDVKGIDMGNKLVRYKAEIDFDGRELARSYLDSQDMEKLLEECRSFQNIDALEAFILKHSENIIDRMGGEIDRIELKLRRKFPEIRHCDLEVL